MAPIDAGAASEQQWRAVLTGSSIMFLSPLWLWAGGAGCALPLLAHLWSLRRHRAIHFPAARFVRTAGTKRWRRGRLRDGPLLATRALVVLLISAAFARPTLVNIVSSPGASASEGRGVWGGHALGGDDWIILLDASASMTRRSAALEGAGAGGSCFDAARMRAIRLLESLDPVRDRAAVVLGSLRPSPLLPSLTANIPALIAGLRTARPTLETCDATAALELAESMSAGATNDAGRARRVVCFSDFQLSNWGEIRGSDGYDLALRPVIPDGSDAGGAILSLALSPRRPTAKAAARVTVRIANHEPGPRAIPVTVKVEDSSGRAALVGHTAEVPPRSEAELRFDFTFSAAGPALITASIPSDGFSADDTRRAVADVVRSPRSAIVGAKGDVREFSHAAAWIDAALEARTIEGADAEPVVRLPTGQLDPATLGRYDDLVVVEAGAVDDATLDALRERLRAAGSVLWVLDSRASARSLMRLIAREAAASADALPAQAPGWDDEPAARSEASDAPLRVASIDQGAVSLHSLGERALGALLEIPVAAPAALPGAIAGKAVTTAWYSDDSPFLMELLVAGSRIVILRADLDPARSGLVRSAVFPALLAALLDSTRARAAPAPGWVVGAPVVVALPRAGEGANESGAYDSLARAVSLERTPSALLARFEPLSAPGFVSLVGGGRYAGASAAVNLDSAESDTATLSESRRASFERSASPAREGGGATSVDPRPDERAELWPYCLLGALLLMSIESMLAGQRTNGAAADGRLAAGIPDESKRARLMAAAPIGLLLSSDPLLRPALDPMFTVVAAALAVLLTHRGSQRTAGSRRAALVSMRTVAIAAIAFLLLGPSISSPSPPSARTPLTILVDTSRSMGTMGGAVGGRGAGRLDALRDRWLDPEYLARLLRYADVRIASFSDRVAPIGLAEAPTLEADGRGTDLAHALEYGLGATAGQSPPRHVLLLSDAIDTTGRTASSLAALVGGRGAHIHSVAPDDAATPFAPDIAVRARVESALTPLGEPARIHLSIEASGYDNHQATIRVVQTDPPPQPGEPPLALRRVTLGVDREVSIDIRPRPAPASVKGILSVACVASIEPAESEINTANNSDPFFVQVTGERIRAVIFEGEPSWESRYLLAALSRDARFEITVVHALGATGGEGSGVSRRPLRTRRITPGVERTTEEVLTEAPLSQAEIDGFDIIVLGRGVDSISPGFMAERMARYLSGRGEGVGGTVVLLRGDPFSESAEAPTANSAFASLLPLRFVHEGAAISGSIGLRATAEGVRHFGQLSEAIEAAPDITAVARVTELSPLATVWLEAVDTERSAGAGLAPALVEAPAGSGRVIMSLAEGMWRWSMAPPGSRVVNETLRDFWPFLFRRAVLADDRVRSDALSIALDRTLCAPGESVTIVLRGCRADVAGIEPVVQVAGPGDRAPTEAPLSPAPTADGRWTGSFKASEPGITTVRLVGTAGIAREATNMVARLNVRDDSREMLRLSPDRRTMAALAGASGGVVYGMGERDAFARLLELESVASAASPTGSVRESAWRTPWVFWPIVSLLGAEWLLRRRMGER